MCATAFVQRIIARQSLFNSKTGDSVLRKERKLRSSVADVGCSGKSPIYINEHLCPQLKRLLAMTIEKKKEMKWWFVWTTDGKIFARRTESLNALQITCVADLVKIDEHLQQAGVYH
ncbi:hypothetical protein HPB49_005620 [Dermacentor silvarum]|uniref:Uncharacterized protein n=1 Tax=Dermacentor silvarum TaxID=543639 RepID=A0ACB8CDH3_DERSI|nr:hypothetical protein HPB49_005620 [Dermacentor silvarum]